MNMARDGPSMSRVRMILTSWGSMAVTLTKPASQIMNDQWIRFAIRSLVTRLLLPSESTIRDGLVSKPTMRYNFGKWITDLNVFERTHRKCAQRQAMSSSCNASKKDLNFCIQVASDCKCVRIPSGSLFSN